MIFDHSPRMRLSLALYVGIMGAAMVGILSTIVVTEAPFMLTFGATFTKGGGDNAFSFAQNAAFGAAGGGGIMLFSMVLGIFGHLTRLRAFYYTFLVLAVLGGFIGVISSALQFQLFPMVGEDSYLEDTNSINPPLTGVKRDALDFSIAIFNKCCAEKGQSGQPRVLPCTGSNANDCPALNDPIIKEYLGSNSNVLLCSCASSPERLAGFENAIANSNLCEVAQTALIDVVGMKLPPKAGNLKVTFLTELRYPNLNYRYVPLVGWFETRATDPSPTPGQYPFGCGLGYVKGVSFMLDKYFQQKLNTPVMGALAIALLELFGVAVALYIGYAQKQESLELGSKKPNKWDQVHDMPSGFLGRLEPTPMPVAGYMGQADPSAGWGGDARVVESIQMPQAGAHDSLASSASSMMMQQQKDAISAKLREFYAKNDPNKNLSDVDDVAQWTVLNGVAALNAKLKAKYNADLDSVEGADASQAGIGSKVLKGDLEI